MGIDVGCWFVRNEQRHSKIFESTRGWPVVVGERKTKRLLKDKRKESSVSSRDTVANNNGEEKS